MDKAAVIDIEAGRVYVGGLSRTTMKGLLSRPVEDGGIPSFKVGRRRLIPIAALDRWIQERTAEGERERVPA